MKRKLVYILSPSFSGSTLLTMMMALHPRINTIGELKATAMGPIDKYLCSCGAPIQQCDYWKKQTERLNQNGGRFSLDNFGTHFTSENPIYRRILCAQIRGFGFEHIRDSLLRFLPPLSKEFKNILQNNERFIENAVTLQAGDIFLDGSKDPQRLKYYLNSGKWDVFVIYMTRDGRAQSLSSWKRHGQLSSYEAAVKEWKSTIAQMNQVVGVSKTKNLHKLQYEALCEDPNKEMNRLWGFLEIDPIEYDWSHIDLKDTEHHILGNSMRTKSDIKIRLDEKWKQQITQEENQIFETLAGKINSSLGYKGGKSEI